jgi:3-dehydroquinate synthetase
LTRQVAASVLVPVTGGGYPVLIGSGLLDRLDELLGELPGAEAAAVVSSPPVAAVAGRAGTALARRGLAVHQLEVPVGEEAKRLAVVAGGWPRSRPAGPTRWWRLVAAQPPMWPGSRPPPGCAACPW